MLMLIGVVRCIGAANNGSPVLPKLGELYGVGDNLQQSETKNDYVDVITNCTMPYANGNSVVPILDVVSIGDEVCSIQRTKVDVNEEGTTIWVAA